MQNNLNKALNADESARSEEILNRLMGIAAQKLGVSESELKAKLESGELEAAVKNSKQGGAQLEKLKKTLQKNPSAAKKLMNDPEIGKILKN